MLAAGYDELLTRDLAQTAEDVLKSWFQQWMVHGVAQSSSQEGGSSYAVVPNGSMCLDVPQIHISRMHCMTMSASQTNR